MRRDFSLLIVKCWLIFHWSILACQTSITLMQQSQLESLEERRKILRLAIMHSQVAVPAANVVFQSLSWHRCKPTETDYCEILHWELQTVLQHQGSERLECCASFLRVRWLQSRHFHSLAYSTCSVVYSMLWFTANAAIRELITQNIKAWTQDDDSIK